MTHTASKMFNHTYKHLWSHQARNAVQTRFKGKAACLMRADALLFSLSDSKSNSFKHQFCTSSSLGSSEEPTTRGVSRFSIPDRDEVQEDVRERMDKEQEKAGFLANVFAVFSRRPDEFNCFMNYYDTLMGDREGGSLTRAEKELIVTATSAKNTCLYCTVAHGALHRVYSKRPLVADQVSTNIEYAELTARERAIVEFSMRVSAMEPVTDADIDALGDHGLDREDVWDVGAVTAFFSMSNRYAHFSAMMPNREFYTIGRAPKSK